MMKKKERKYEWEEIKVYKKIRDLTVMYKIMINGKVVEEEVLIYIVTDWS